MKKISKICIILSVAALALTHSGAAYSSNHFRFIRDRQVTPSGKDTTIVFPGIRTNYSELDASGAFSVHYSNTAKEVTVTVDENLVPYLDIRSSGDALEIGLKSISLNELKRAEVLVPVSSRSLTSIDLSGACAFRSDITLTGNDLSLDMSGASKAEIDVDVRELGIDLSGASAACISGKARKADMDCSGASKIKGNNHECLRVDKAYIDISGAGSIKGIQGGKISGDLSGASKLSVLQGSDISGIKCSGASRINVIE